MIDELRPRTIVVRYEHEIDSLDRVASVLRRQRVRAEAFTAVASHDRATVQATLGIKSEGLAARGLAVRPQVVVDDDAAAGILRYAAQNAFDLVAMATRSHGGLERLLLGSVADRVLRKAETSLLLWNPGLQPVLEPVVEAPGALAGVLAPAQA